MTDNEIKHRERSTSSTVIFLFILLGIPMLLFAPLALSFVEHSTMGTGYVEDFCREMGIHGFLSKIYRPILKLFNLF